MRPDVRHGKHSKRVTAKEYPKDWQLREVIEMKGTIFSFSTRVVAVIGATALFVLVLAPSELNAHGGRLNKCGCHFDRSTNPPTCHCHQAPYGGCGPECYSSYIPSVGVASGCAVVSPELLAKALADPVLTRVPVPAELQVTNDKGRLKSAIWAKLTATVRYLGI